LQARLVSLALYGRYGLADAAFAAGDHARVAELLDPLIDAASKPEDSPLKAGLQKDNRMATALLSFALRSNIMLPTTARAGAVLGGLDAVTADGDGGGDVNMLKLLAVLIRQQVEGLAKAGDQKALKAARTTYTELLSKRTAKLAKRKTAPPAEV